MKKNQLLIVAVFALIFSAFTLTTLVSWNIADDYEIRFEGRGAVGSFSDLDGAIIFDVDNLAQSKMNVSVDVATISTGNKTKDRHARGSNWFDAKKYPKISFQSKEFKKSGNSYEVIGDLNLHGVIKEITIPFTFTNQNSGGLFEGSFTVNRQDYGITGPFYGFTVADELKVDLKVPVEQ